jgi:hypothetical protein
MAGYNERKKLFDSCQRVVMGTVYSFCSSVIIAFFGSSTNENQPRRWSWIAWPWFAFAELTLVLDGAVHDLQ